MSEVKQYPVCGKLMRFGGMRIYKFTKESPRLPLWGCCVTNNHLLIAKKKIKICVIVLTKNCLNWKEVELSNLLNSNIHHQFDQ